MKHHTKIFRILFYPWRKYSEFFDKNCWGIWGLSPILKFTFLYFAAFFIPPIFGWVKTNGNSSAGFEGLFILALLIMVLIWLLYLPVLTVILLYRLSKQMTLIASQTVNLLGKTPWEMTPKKLYTQPHWAIVVYLIFLKFYLIDFLDWTTQFFPISLLFASKVPYSISIKIRHMARSFEIRIAALKIPFKYTGFDLNQNFTLLKFEPYEDIEDFEKVFKKLEKNLKHEYSFYVRHGSGQINIIVPHAKQEQA